MIIKHRSRIIQELDAKSFTVLGSPGSDGLGAGALQMFHAGLIGAQGDFVVVLGDISPIGRDPYYHQVADFVDIVSPKPVYVMRGNHDGPDYSEYFGLDNCAILSEEYLLIMLDNSKRRFTDETLTFLRETMALVGSDNVMVAFHVPPPNRFNGNSMSVDEWQRFEDAVGVWRNRISLLICSHAHSGFEDEVDGLRLVVTGGAGAQMHGQDRLAKQQHHALEITLNADGKPEVSMRTLSQSGIVDRREDVAEALRRLYGERCRNRVELILRAEDAEKDGAYNLARLYRAASESCLHQARSLYRLLRGDNQGVDLAEDAAQLLRAEALALEANEVEMADVVGCDVLSELTVRGVNATNRSFLTLLDRAARQLREGDIGATKYFVCQSCGFMSSGSEEPTYCSACGAPSFFIEQAD